MKDNWQKRALSALPIFVLAAIAIVFSAQVIGCDNCRETRGGEVCD